MAELRSRSGHLERLLATVEASESPAELRLAARTAIGLLIEIYSAALGRAVDLAGACADPALREALADDPITGPLLAMAGRHPFDAAERARRVLATFTGDCERRHCLVELESIDAAALTIRLARQPRANAEAVQALRTAIEGALLDRIPEVDAITFLDPDDRSAVMATIPLANLRRGQMAVSSPAS
jgi:hypothetical protein